MVDRAFAKGGCRRLDQLVEGRRERTRSVLYMTFDGVVSGYKHCLSMFLLFFQHKNKLSLIKMKVEVNWKSSTRMELHSIVVSCFDGCKQLQFSATHLSCFLVPICFLIMLITVWCIYLQSEGWKEWVLDLSVFDPVEFYPLIINELL